MWVMMVFVALLGTALVTEQNARRRTWLLWAAPLPALGVALWAYAKPSADTVFQAPSILLGLQWQLNPTLVPLLIMTALLWALAGFFASRDFQPKGNELKPHAARFLRCWLLTLTGNLGLLVAQDIASFYLFFALMTFAAYGLVIHDETREAIRAGKIYIIMAIIGEAFILAGLIAAAASVGGEHTPLMSELPQGIAGNEHGLWIATALFIGFGVKAGLAGVHWWLPLAHPVAPTPASAVLSGAMIKAGLVGWLLTLPLGSLEGSLINLNGLANAAIALGLIGAWGAAFVGVLSDKAKAVLAYSSISQMGMLTFALGIALKFPDTAPYLIAAIVIFACHHGINKGLLFLGVGWRKAASPGAATIVTMALLAVPALNLIGVPFSSGEYAKDSIKAVLSDLPFGALYALFSYGALATTVLIVKFAYLLWHRR